MEETICQMRKRHAREILKLQSSCKHKRLTKWCTEWWAIAHCTGFEVKVCIHCGKVIRKRTKCTNCGIIIETESHKKGDGHKLPFGSWYCEKCYNNAMEAKQ